ncbi:MAG: hypothetical protein Tp118SUR00d2C21406351_13 [Prokaryotic dsDNA virus sp.]|nr:MAG: hypothetical protein Tp118SUR00d2C21406351_13 [Prokaryotic dsDNA virus sp.]|tara:strand:- start:233 stop:649 length:417 start_codon:yes stop_codon:yes gene_type:complete
MKELRNPYPESEMTMLEDFERMVESGTLELEKIAEKSKEECELRMLEVLRSAKISGESRASELRGAIKTLSDINESYLNELTTLEARNAELLEAVKKAHEILLHEMDNGRTPSMLQGVGLGYFEDIIAGLDVAQSRRG